MQALLKSKIPLVALVAWCLALLVVRTWYAGNATYSFLYWNIFLAVVPVVAAVVLVAAVPCDGLAGLKVGAFVVWLAFLPNAPYMATDLIHLTSRPPVPLWFDVALFGSFAATGILLGYSAVEDVEAVLAERFGRVTGTLVAIASLLLCGFGIYLGRVLRLNSWDVVVSPLSLARLIAHQVAHPVSHTGTWAVSAVYGVGLVLGYLALHGWASARRGPSVRVSA